MKKICVYSFLLALINMSLIINQLWAADIYVDPSLTNDCTNGNYSAVNRNCNGSDGDAYDNLQEAINAMSSGDDIFLRGGTYQCEGLTGSTSTGCGAVEIPQSKNGTYENWSSIQSYPGEWAKLDGENKCGTDAGVLGNRNLDKDGTGDVKYWRFERLEITGGANDIAAYGYQPGDRARGLFVTGGPFIVRYCYFHDITNDDGGGNPAAIVGAVWHDSTVEYCWFEDNGTTGTTNEHHSATAIQIHSDYHHGVSDWETAPYDIDHVRGKNEFRYNLIVNNDNIAKNGYKDKGRQYLTPKTDVSWTHKEYGNKVHHNIFLNMEIGILSQQDFDQIYNNIIVCNPSLADSKDLGINLLEGGLSGNTIGPTVYNNTIIGGRIQNNFGFGSTYVANPYYYAYNNLLVDPRPYSGGKAVFGIGNPYMESAFTYDSSRTDIDHNYIYIPNSSTDIRVTRNSGDCYETMTMEEYDTCYSAENYTKESSEGSDNLFSGDSGYSQYVTRGTHVISGSATIESGGLGASHPYLSGVTIPSYIGATDPNDNGWVAKVLSLSDRDVLKNGQADSAWEEGDDSQAAVDEVPGDVGGLQIIMD